MSTGFGSGRAVFFGAGAAMVSMASWYCGPEKFAHQFLSPGFLAGGVEGQGLIAGDHQVVVVYRGQLRPGKLGVEGPAFFFLEEGQE